jgi:hypothetical protein
MNKPTSIDARSDTVTRADMNVEASPLAAMQPMYTAQGQPVYPAPVPVQVDDGIYNTVMADVQLPNYVLPLLTFIVVLALAYHFRPAWLKHRKPGTHLDEEPTMNWRMAFTIAVVCAAVVFAVPIVMRMWRNHSRRQDLSRLHGQRQMLGMAPL